MPSIKHDVSTDEEIRYALTVRAAYEKMRSLFVQLGGLMILESAKREIPVGTDNLLAHARQNLKEIEKDIWSKVPPEAFEKNHRYLTRSVEDLGSVLEGLTYTRAKAADRGNVVYVFERAYKAFKEGGSRQLGLEPLDLRQSCCASEIVGDTRRYRESQVQKERYRK